MKIRRLTNRDCLAILSSFALVEVMVAVLVVSIAVVSLYTGVSSGFALVKLAREDLRATQIMLQRMETLRLYKWSDFKDATFFSTNDYAAYYDPAGQAVGSGGMVYTVKTAISFDTPPANYTTNMDMARVTVRVSWLSGKLNRRREVSTFVARYGMQNYIYNTNALPAAL